MYMLRMLFRCFFSQDANQIGEVNGQRFDSQVTIRASNVQRTNLGISRRTKFTLARMARFIRGWE